MDRPTETTLAPKLFIIDHYCHAFVKTGDTGLQLFSRQPIDLLKYLMVTSLLTNVIKILLACLQCVTLTDLKSKKIDKLTLHNIDIVIPKMFVKHIHM